VKYIIIILLCSTCFGNSIDYLLRINGSYNYVITDADHIEGVHFTQWFAHSFTSSVFFGKAFDNFFYWGLSYSHWFSGRKYQFGDELRSDILERDTLGLEIGYLDQTVRYYYLFTLGVGYPLKNRIITTGLQSGVYSDREINLSTEIRINLGLKFSKIYSLLLEIGYRYCYLGKLMNDEIPFMDKRVNFSGPFIGFGIAFHI